MIDCHCHLYDEKFNNILDTIVSQELECIVTSSDSVNVFDKCRMIAEKYNNIFFTVGIHPHNADTELNKTSGILNYLQHPKCIGIGEIGLDYYYDFSDKKNQFLLLEKQVKIAIEYKKNIIIHSRGAELEILNFINESNCKTINILLHCYTGPIDILEKFIEIKNIFFSVGGMITFKKNENILEILRKIPLNKLLIETDSPYLAPIPMRGTVNKPEYIKYTYNQISDILNIDKNKLIDLIKNNYYSFLKNSTF